MSSECPYNLRTYFLAYRRKKKLLYLIDFFKYKEVQSHFLNCHDSSSDHTPVIATVRSNIIRRETKSYLYNKYTDWQSLQQNLDNIDLKISLKNKDEIDNATEYITSCTQKAARLSKPSVNKST